MAKRAAPTVTEDQWEKYKNHILKLYIEKRYSMEIVREKLAKKKFIPTPKWVSPRIHKGAVTDQWFLSEGQIRARVNKVWGLTKRARRARISPVATTAQSRVGLAMVRSSTAEEAEVTVQPSTRSFWINAFSSMCMLMRRSVNMQSPTRHLFITLAQMTTRATRARDMNLQTLPITHRKRLATASHHIPSIPGRSKPLARDKPNCSRTSPGTMIQKKFCVTIQVPEYGPTLGQCRVARLPGPHNHTMRRFPTGKITNICQSDGQTPLTDSIVSRPTTITIPMITPWTHRMTPRISIIWDF